MDAPLDPAPSGPLGLDRRFWRYAGATVSAGFGDGVRYAAVPLLAASLTRAPALVAAVAASQTLPWLLVNPISGVIVDRHDRRKVMRLAALSRIILAATLIAALVAGKLSIPLLAGLGFLLGASDTFGSNAASGLLPSLVPRARLERANAVTGGMYAVGENLAGPAVGAPLFSIAVILPFTTDLAAFALAALLLGFMRGDFRAVGAPDADRRLAAEMGDGIRWLRAHRPLRVLALLVGAQNLGFGMILGVLVLFVLEQLRLPRVAYGLLLGVLAAGGVAASLLLTRFGAHLSSVRTLYLVLAVEGAGTLAVWALPVLPVVLLGFFAAGFFAATWDVVVVSYRQREVPEVLLGRVTAAFRTVGIGASRWGPPSAACWPSSSG